MFKPYTYMYVWSKPKGKLGGLEVWRIHLVRKIIISDD